MAHTSYDWFLLDMAIARAGLISVPIYETSSAEQIEWIVSDSDVCLVITESGTLAELVRGAVAGIGHTVEVRCPGLRRRHHHRPGRLGRQPLAGGPAFQRPQG